MTGDNTTRKKAGAVFFAAIMVVSMVGVGFAGSAAAEATSVTTTGADLGGDGLTDITVQHDSTATSTAAYIIDVDGDGEYTEDDLYASADASDSDSTLFENVDVNSLEAGEYDVYAAHGDSGESDEPTLGDGVDITESGWAQTSGTLKVIDVAVSPEPDQVFEDEIQEISVATEDHPDGVEADYTVTAPDGNGDPVEVTSGTTNADGTFSFTADPAGDVDGLSPGDEYTVEVDYSNLDGYSGSSTATVLVAPSVNLNFSTDPAAPGLEDDVTFSGSLTNDDGDRPADFDSLDVVYNGDNDAVLRNIRVLSNGEFDSGQSAVVDDAGNYSVVYTDTNANEFVLDTFEVAPEEGSLTLSGDDVVAGGGADDFTAELTNASGGAITLTEEAPAEGTGAPAGTEGFVAVDGNFSAVETDFSVEDDATLLRVVGFSEDTGETTVYDIAGADALADVEASEDKIVEFHALNTDNGQLNFTAEPTTAEQTIDASVAVRTDSGDGFSTDELATGGVEDRSYVSTGTLDIQAAGDSVEVGTGDDLNVDTTTYESDAKTTEDPLSVNDADQTIEVSVTGSDFADVSDATDTTLDFAEVNITSDQFTGDSQKSKTLGDGENVDSTSGPADFNNLNFEEGGEVLVEVTAEEREDGETTATYTYNETLTVEGDNIVDYSPSEVTAGETQDVTVQVANSEGNLVADRTITFTPDDGATASGDDVNTNTIELTSNNFDTSSDAYIAENVTFDTPGTFDVTVDDGGDPATTTVDTEEAITVTGEERYDVRTDDELLAGSGDDVTLEVYDISGDEEQLVNDSTELDELATNIELEQGGDAGVVTDDGTTTDAENGTITVSNLNAVGADAEPVNVTVSTPDDAFTGDGQINVVEPEITTNLNDEVLTEGVTAEDVEISVTDPRDGSAVDGDIRFTANGTDDDLIEFDINNTDTAAGANTVVTNGNQETIPLGSSGQANVTITPSAIEDAANATLVLDASPEADGNFYSASDVDAGNLQLFERENGQDVELRDEFAFDFDGEVTYVLRDADGDRLDNRDVTVRPSGTDNIDDTTEEGFFNVNYSNVDLEEGGTVAFDSASEFNGDITVATADVTQNLQEVELTASVESDSVVQGNDFNFSVIRSDFSEDTQADLAFVNASGDEVLSTGTGAVDTDGYGVVDSSDLETGDYTVEVSKDNSNGNTFLNDTVNVSVTERITDVSLDPSTVEANTTVEHDLQYTALGVSGDGNTDTLVATLPASASFADIDNATINVTDADGNEVSITGSPSLSDTNDGTNNQLQFDISPEQDIDATVDATFEVAFPDVNESTTEDITLEVQDSTEGTFTTTTPVTIQPADAEPVPTATVTFSDQTVTNGSDTVTVDSANLSEGGFVVIHAEDNGSAGAVLGNSSYLANGTSENITITLDEPLTANTSLVAMAHLDTDGDEAYEFDGGSVDAPYTEDGSAVVDTASITVETVEGPGDVTGNGEPAQDLNGDGVFEDVNGDGEYTVSDVQALFAALDDAEGELAFDINGDGQVTVSDVQALFAQL